MPEAIKYYFSPISGYAYLGHQAFVDLTREAQIEIQYYPVDISRVFMATGTTPPARQSEARKSYRHEDMARYADMYELPLNVKPVFWPAASDLACKAIIASKHLALDQSSVAGAILSGVWAWDADIANAVSLQYIFDSVSLPGSEILDMCEDKQVNDDFYAFTQSAIESGIFGSPTYVVDGERYWGQDRLPLIRQRLLS